MAVTFVDRICSDLERKILAGEMPPDQRIPSIAEMGRNYRASPGAVRHAIKKLQRRGLVYCVHGKGTFVGTSRSSELRKRLTDVAFLVVEDRRYTHRRDREILRGAEEEAHSRNYHVIYAEADCNDLEGLRRRAASLERRDLLGMVHVGVVDRRHEEILRQIAIPLVLTSDVIYSRALIGDIDIVTNDNYTEAVSAAERLVDLGHRHIGFLSVLDQEAWGGLIREGFVAGLSRHGLSLDRTGDFSLTGGDRYRNYELGYELSGTIASRPAPHATAYFAAGSSLAAGLIDGLIDRGMGVPDRVSVCGQATPGAYDVMMRSRHVLSGPAMSWAQIGRDAIRRLMDLRETGARPGRHLITGSWFEGTTVAAARSGG